MLIFGAKIQHSNIKLNLYLARLERNDAKCDILMGFQTLCSVWILHQSFLCTFFGAKIQISQEFDYNSLRNNFPTTCTAFKFFEA